ncbi:Xaa-Pro aminopeptidase [Psychromonas sp. 14N.309.X.WAT.B.A12]|uniref:Xaa-Pro aminopeptidase n=1 Tax=unclassified Psychromonas TaxID=2614957 RepID=UPI0025B25BA4|nr:Xaa-Pro aminopeptidase [Psychromonas sp. 14N.309.X.WAT.B.A12]MDN2662663.1 Xaa-Pro aminopeptidase [Psychromonas sp. 14N.309.X.WAT.B.A12]
MTEFTKRRQLFAHSMLDNSMAIFPANQELTRSNDTEFRFRQNSDFYYLCGFNEPDACLLLIKQNNQLTTVLFNRKKDKNAEIWHGYRLGQTEAIKTLDVDHAFVIDDFETKLSELLEGIDTLYYPTLSGLALDLSLQNVLNGLRSRSRSGLISTHQFLDWRPTLHEMRLFKSEAEQAIMRKAGEISALGHVRAMQQCKPGMFEFQLQLEVEYEFARQGTRDVAYNSIVAGGNNACILHYTENDQVLQDGDLVLIDAGAEYQGYAGDITRTFPVNGRFTEEQAIIYQLVLDCQLLALELVKPGISVLEINQQVVTKMTEGLLTLGLLKGELTDLIEEQAYKAFYMHGLGHPLGLDVHDVGDTGTIQSPRALQAGMAITIEPGLYISQDADVEARWKGIGVRIEDDVIVTETGCEILTAAVPKEIEAIEALMNG